MMQLDAVAEYLTEWGVVERCVAAARLLSGVLDCCGLEFLTRAPTLGTLSVHGPAACAALASANATYGWRSNQGAGVPRWNVCVAAMFLVTITMYSA